MRAKLEEEARRRGLRIPGGPAEASEQPFVPYLEWLKSAIPRTWRVDYAHVRAIADLLDRVAKGEVDRFAIFMPPRHFKTETVTVRFAVKCLQEDPESNFLITSYNERLARRFGRKARNVALMRNMQLDPDKTAMDEWATKEGGVLMASGVGSPPTGVGFKGILIDDPIKNREEAESATYRENVWEWYRDDLYTRLEPDAWLGLILTRWHHDDLAARAIESEKDRFVVLNLAAIAETNDPLGRQPGEALCPDRYDVAALERIRSVQGAHSFEALYQQNPTPREGALFQVSKLAIVSRVPEGLPSCRAWDYGATQGDGDYTATVRMWGPDQDGLFYVKPLRFQLEPAARNKEMRRLAEADGRETRIRLPQEPGAAGKEIAQRHVSMLAGYSAVAKPISGDKELRADPYAAQVNAGNVRVVCDNSDLSKKMVRDYIEELRQFPSGKHDDMVDASADALSELAIEVYEWQVF